MCTAPGLLDNGQLIACRKCWQCAETKVDDWVGRNIAESKTAKAAHVVTLTYGQDQKTGDIDHLRSVVLTYSDIQKFLKRLRAHGFPVRYFAVGEYGSKKGRAHWHIILYWQGRVPEVKLRTNILFDHWQDEDKKPLGLTYWDQVSPQAIRYACKYLAKDALDETKQMFGPMPSKKPPLGDAYFKALAARHVDQGLVPHDLTYSFPDVRRVPRGTTRNSAPIQFVMRGVTADTYLDTFTRLWREKYNDEPPASEAVWNRQDKLLRQYLEEKAEPRFERRGYVPRPSKPMPGADQVRFSETKNAFYCDLEGVRYWYSYDTEGELSWDEKIGPDQTKRAQQRLQQERELKRSYRLITRGD